MSDFLRRAACFGMLCERVMDQALRVVLFPVLVLKYLLGLCGRHAGLTPMHAQRGQHLQVAWQLTSRSPQAQLLHLSR